MQQVAHTLEVLRSAIPVTCQQIHAQLVDRRARLNSHVARMHCRREPTNKSVYELQGLVLRLQRTVNSSVRWRGAELARLTPEVSRQVNDLLVEAGGLASLFLRSDSSSWTGAVLPDGAAVQEALELVQRLYTDRLPAGLESIHAVTAQTGLKRPEAVADLRMLAELLESIKTTLANYAPVIYEQNLQGILHDLSPAQNGGLAAAWAFCICTPYRRARVAVLSLRNGKAPSKTLVSE